MKINTRAFFSSFLATTGTYLLTSAHHAYGAKVYGTPWRLHVVFLGAVLLSVVAILAYWAFRSGRRAALASYIWASVIPFGLGIGLFEGGYNHLLKNLVYFAGVQPSTFDRLYPANIYERPTDAVFEASGVLQLVLGVIQIWLLWRLWTQANGPHQSCSHESRIKLGTIVSPFEVRTIQERLLQIPDPSARFVHLQFRRFAGCPICNTHLRSFMLCKADLENAGVREVVFFHSSLSNLVEYEKDITFDVVADSEKRFYRQFGVEASKMALIHPAVIQAVFRSIGVEKFRFPKVENGRLGLPADILLDASGRVIACKFGAHAADHWEVSDLLELVGAGSVASSDARRLAIGDAI